MQRNNLRLLPRTVTYGCCKFEIFALNMTAFPAIPLPPSSLTHHMFSTPTHHHPHTTTHTPPPTHQNPASHWRPTDADTAISQSRTTWRETTEHMTPCYIQFHHSTLDHAACSYLKYITGVICMVYIIWVFIIVWCFYKHCCAVNILLYYTTWHIESWCLVLAPFQISLGMKLHKWWWDRNKKNMTCFQKMHIRYATSRDHFWDC